jgi:hypothetical protein
MHVHLESQSFAETSRTHYIRYPCFFFTTITLVDTSTGALQVADGIIRHIYWCTTGRRWYHPSHLLVHLKKKYIVLTMTVLNYWIVAGWNHLRHVVHQYYMFVSNCGCITLWNCRLSWQRELIYSFFLEMHVHLESQSFAETRRTHYIRYPCLTTVTLATKVIVVKINISY